MRLIVNRFNIGDIMKTVLFSAVVLACTTSFASAQQYVRTAGTPYWYQISNPTQHVHTYDYRYAGVPSVRVIQPQVIYTQPQYAQPQAVYTQPGGAYVLPDATYAQPQVVYVQPQAAYGQQQPLIVQRPHHKPANLAGYWPFISKAHSDYDFNRGVIHVYGGN